MTKPNIDTLEAIAVKNMMDFLVSQARDIPIGDKKRDDERIKTLAERYKSLTGQYYIYHDDWKREID